MDDTIKANCERYRVQYINPSMSVDDRHEMFQKIETTNKRIQKQNETTHMRDGKKENDMMQKQQKGKQEIPTKRKSRQAKDTFWYQKKSEVETPDEKDM